MLAKIVLGQNIAITSAAKNYPRAKINWQGWTNFAAAFYPSRQNVAAKNCPI